MISPAERELSLFDDDTYVVVAYDQKDAARVTEEAGMGEADDEWASVFVVVPLDTVIELNVDKGTKHIADIDSDPATKERLSQTAAEWIAQNGRCFLYMRC